MAGHTQDQKRYQFLIDQQGKLQLELDKELATAKAINDTKEEQRILNDKIAERQRVINELSAKYGTLTDKQKKALEGLINDQKEATKQLREQNKQLVIQEKKVANLKAGFQAVGQQIRMMTRYLMDNDKIIKNTILNLGLSGSKADLMRSSFEQSAAHVARMGGSLEDVQKVMEGYAEETGKARVLSASMVDDIVKIGRGTGLGVEQATKLGAQFEIMGFDVRKTVDYVQGIVDTSERMGVNTTKVLKNLNDNFKKLQTFTFIGGSKAMASMAINAEKMKVNMASALNLAETTRGLEQVIDMTANLQVMGGEFAKLDPFQALYMSRNEPEKWVEEISKMTRGLYTFKKMADGTFERFISPADKDRLDAVAKSLGYSKEEIHEIAKRRLDMDKMNRDMMSMGLSPREKELIQGAAVLNSTTSKYEVMLAGKMKDVSTLTKDQAKAFATESESLEKRALNAQTFEDALKATIAEFKTGLLPILKAVNIVLAKLRPIAEWFNDWATKGPASWAKVGGILIGAAFVWKGVLSPLIGALTQRVTGGIAGKISGWGGKSTATGTDPIIGGRKRAGANAGKGMMRGGAGIGAAALGVGVGIGAAAAGISLLADALSKLNKDQLEALQGITRTIGIIVGIGVAAGVAITVFSKALGAAAKPVATFGMGLLPLAGAIALIGAGIGAATAGIGYMFNGIAKMRSSSAELANSVGNLGKNFSSFKIDKQTMASLEIIANAAPKFSIIGSAFAQMGQVLSGSKDDWVAIQNAVNAISNANTGAGGMIAELARLIKQPLKVEFADKNVSMTNDITLNLDGQKFMQKAYDVNIAIQKHESLKHGKGQ